MPNTRGLEFLFVIALALYSGVIWRHKFTKRLTPAMLILFGLGLKADIAGTFLVCAAAENGWQLTLHTATGFLSLIIMGLHFAWALSAFKFQSSAAYFNRFSVYAWGLWLVSFVSGIPLA